MICGIGRFPQDILYAEGFVSLFADLLLPCEFDMFADDDFRTVGRMRIDVAYFVLGPGKTVGGSSRPVNQGSFWLRRLMPMMNIKRDSGYRCRYAHPDADGLPGTVATIGGSIPSGTSRSSPSTRPAGILSKGSGGNGRTKNDNLS